MKMSHYIILFIIIILPFSIFVRNNMKEYFLTLKDKVRLNNVIDIATQDALETLIDLNDEFQMLSLNTTFDINQTLAKEAVKNFFQTVAINNNMPYIYGQTESYFSVYIPAIVIVGYDGFFIYSVDETSTGGFAYQMSPKIPYSYYDSATGAIVNFTLGNYVKLYINKKLYEGEITEGYYENANTKYQEFVNAFGSENSAFNNISGVTSDMSVILAALYRKSTSYVPSFLIARSSRGDIPVTQDYARGTNREASAFHKKRREVIMNLIRETLQQEINSHQTYAKIMGSNYDFSIPEIADDDWTNAINDISIMSFIQGMPIGTHSYYNNYALGASRIIQTDYIYGTNSSGVKIYHKSDCALVSGAAASNVKDIFLNKYSAAEAGYWPCLRCRP